MQHRNRLAAETSPYLLQHAHNPVDWYPWGEEALQKARTENRPILVSIGYSACHWCHVMERESFEDEGTARLMNEEFINIKIDREERPDLDHIYMEAVQTMTGSGGWPLNVFLTPEGKPFYGGTYFPPRPAHNRPSWKDVLSGVARAYRDKPEEIEAQAQSLTRHIRESNAFGQQKTGVPGGEGAGTPDSYGTVFNRDTLREICEQLLKNADKEEGGFGRAPKFPQTFSIQYLLHYYYFTKEEKALEHACLSLDKMIRGGLYDQLGGGFARYSTDEQWLAPHFEKMLYDNALLVIVLSEAYQLTKKELYREAIEHTMEFIDRELSTAEEGKYAFYSALDADSEGVEGKYYIWEQSEIESVLGEDAALFCRCYGVSPGGNWEGHNILVRAIEPDSLPGEERGRLEKARVRLLKHRSGRIRPALDDKILLGWNALMTIACCKAYAALGKEEYRQRAVRNMDFCWKHFRGHGEVREGLQGKEQGNAASGPGSPREGRQEALAGSGQKDGGQDGVHFFFHVYTAGKARFPAFLDDYAYLIAALLQLQEITGDQGYLLKAKELTLFVEKHFSEEGTGLFYFTHEGQKDLILRKKEIYDGATPSGNAMMAFNLSYMAIIFNESEWAERARRMAASLERVVRGYPGSFAIWATLYQAITYFIPEVVMTGEQLEGLRKEFLREIIPYRVFQSTTKEDTHFPLLYQRPPGEIPLIFLCRNYACQLPVNQVPAFIRLLENVQKFSE